MTEKQGATNSQIFSKLKVRVPSNTYPIYFSSNYLHKTGSIIRDHLADTQKAFVISDDNVFPLYGEKLMKSLTEAGFSVSSATIPAGEASKTLDNAALLLDKLVEQELERSSVVVSLGGGVVGDLAGFVAATYMRGINFVQVPTSLLAQVDSSIGGKVAVNHPRGKNLIGAFYQPRLVLIDVATLSTLKEEDFLSGLGEVIKHGVGFDYDYWQFLQQNRDNILALEESSLARMIAGSCQIKKNIVEQDEKEKGVRAKLNLGHTIAHALESLTNYNKYSHGQAVALGLLAESHLAARMGLLSSDLVREIKSTIEDFNLPSKIPEQLTGPKILAALRQDKKSYQGKVTLALPTDKGECQLIRDWQEEDLLEILP